MSNRQTALVTSNAKLTAQRNAASTAAARSTKGTFLPGASGNPGGASRARRELNADTIRAMHAAFREGGKAAIDKVMRQSPAIFLKLLVLLVPRELEVTHTGGVKAMTDEQLEQGIEAIQAMLAKREAGIVDVTPDTPATPDTSSIPDTAPIPSRTRRKAVRNMGTSMGTDSDTPIS
jgi:hypothetical protein